MLLYIFYHIKSKRQVPFYGYLPQSPGRSQPMPGITLEGYAFELNDDLNRKPHRTVIPQACNHVTSLTEGTASTKQPFHSMYTGQLSKKLSNRTPTMAITIAPTNTANFSMSRSVVFQALHSEACFTLFICFILSIYRVQVQVAIPYFIHVRLLRVS